MWIYIIFHWSTCLLAYQTTLSQLLGLHGKSLNQVDKPSNFVLTLCLPIHNHGVTLHFFRSLISLNNMLRLSAYRSFILLSLSLYYFDAAKQYLFLNFIFQLYFAYMNTIDFYIFICSKFINSNRCVDLRMSIYMIVSFRNKDSFTSSFPIHRSFIFLALQQCWHSNVEQKWLKQISLLYYQP